MVEDNRVIREQMEREQAECEARERGVSWPMQEYRQRFAEYSAHSKDKEEWEKEEAYIQEQLKPMLEMKQQVIEKICAKQQAAQEAQAVVKAQTAQEVQTDTEAQAAEIAQAAQETLADIEVKAAQQAQSTPEEPVTKEMSTMQGASATQKAQVVVEVEETEPKTVEPLVKQTPQPAPRRMSGPIGSSHVRDPGDPLFGLTLGQQVLVGRYPGSGGSTPKSPRSPSTPVKSPRRDEPL